MKLSAVLALAIAACPIVLNAQESASSEATPLRLPAPFYDVIGAWELGWGDAPGRGRPGATAAVASRTVVRGANGGVSVRNAPAQVGQAALSQFSVDADSILYRRGSDRAEIAVASVLRIEEVRWPEANQRGWVKVTYEVVNGEESIYFRQANAASQATLAATLRKAVEVNRARAGTARE